ncbi:RNA polymerase sigma factor RpoE [Labilithrix luteola]|uniref:RNA polymerase sigma factor RpoE n=1 Tax=Labilithrix luteola TaxID=1391654 RepID=A0A0K1PWG4_9BACT|nr:sigma-70 family RNA polymerase sigma factor [Labilithrix luteola]AKU97870.1 RNA polymerase sigma factor RpoE [Labilithrix luteola]
MSNIRALQLAKLPPGAVPASVTAAMAEPNPTLECLILQHHEFVWRSLRRLGVPDADLEDAVQEVYLEASKRLASITSARGFLFRACMYVASHARRSIQRRREVHDDELLKRQIDPGSTPEQAIAQSEARQDLQRVLEKIPEEPRAIFILFELERLNTVQIAELLELPVGTVASRLRRARELFLQAAARKGAQENHR